MAELKEAADLASESVDLGVEAVEAVVDVARNHIAWMWGGGFVGALIGAGAGFFLARRLLETKYAEVAESEIDEMREHFRQRLVVRDAKPELSDLGKKVKELKYTDETEDSAITVSAPGEPNVAVPDEVRNIFANAEAKDNWDWEVERAIRNTNPGAPYIIHYDERGETEELEEITLTYYAGDDVLCDSDDKVVEEQDRIVGLENLDKFGHGSNDPAIVYIRNPTLGIEIEVVKSEKTYVEDVAGFKHEEPRRRRRISRDE